MIPDDPRVSETERDGMPYIPNPDCPICGAKDPDTFYFYKTDLTREIIGCDNCIVWDPADTF